MRGRLPDYGEGENHYWTDYFYSRTYGYSGNFSIGIDLSDLNLGDLANDGLLNFSLGVAGDLNLLSATLTADVNETSITPAASIPNPPTLALIGIAMFGLGRKVWIHAACDHQKYGEIEG